MMHILLSTDSNYIMPSAVMMKSVSVNNADTDIVFHILIDGGVTAFQQQQLHGVLTNKRHIVSFHLIDGKFFTNFPALGKVKTYITKATYYRLFISDILPADIQRVIYLDGDMIVRGSLEELWNANIQGKAVGVVTDMALNSKDFSRLGYSESYGYFNAGMLLVNLAYWREHHLKDLFLSLIMNEPQRIVLHDQDVLNITLHDSKVELPAKFNCQNGFLMKPEFSELGKWKSKYANTIEQAIKAPVVVHYTDTIKPWHVEDANPYGYEFIKYYKQTVFRYTPLSECGSGKFRHFIGKVLRRLHLVSPAGRTHDKYYSLEEIGRLS